MQENSGLLGLHLQCQGLRILERIFTSNWFRKLEQRIEQGHSDVRGSLLTTGGVPRRKLCILEEALENIENIKGFGKIRKMLKSENEGDFWHAVFLARIASWVKSRLSLPEDKIEVEQEGDLAINIYGKKILNELKVLHFQKSARDFFNLCQLIQNRLEQKVLPEHRGFCIRLILEAPITELKAKEIQDKADIIADEIANKLIQGDVPSLIRIDDDLSFKIEKLYNKQKLEVIPESIPFYFSYFDESKRLIGRIEEKLGQLRKYKADFYTLIFVIKSTMAPFVKDKTLTEISQSEAVEETFRQETFRHNQRFLGITVVFHVDLNDIDRLEPYFIINKFLTEHNRYDPHNAGDTEKCIYRSTRGDGCSIEKNCILTNVKERMDAF